jgi:hypothetical protein
MSEQSSGVIQYVYLWRDRLLWGAVVTAAALAATLPTPAHAQLSGTWDIVVDDCCTDADGETSCGTEGLSIVVTQTGNHLSGSLLLPEEIPPECNVTCTPATPNCGQRIDLTGTVSGNSVDVTMSSSRSLTADCRICEGQCVHCIFYDETRTTGHLKGTITESMISGSATSETDDTCWFGGDAVCQDLIECFGSTCSGTFQATIEGGPPPSPTATPTPTPAQCVGACDGGNSVTVNDIITMVNIALGNAHISDCEASDGNGDGHITIDEILQAVNNALNGC